MDFIALSLNPFDWRGPAFLLFYVCFTTGALIVANRMRRAAESDPDPHAVKPTVNDPYLVAYLRNGGKETLRLATVTLIDRGLLVVYPDYKIGTKPGVQPALAQNQIERAALEWFKTPKAADSIFKDKPSQEAADLLKVRLTELGLMPNAAMKADRTRRGMVCAAIVLAVAWIKIFVALSRGHHNVLILFFLSLFAVMLAFACAHPLRTPRGDDLLTDLNQLFGRLKQPNTTILPGQSTQELAWLAAVYGLAALPAGDEFAYTRRIYPQGSASSSDAGSSWDSSSSSDSGSSSSDSGSSSSCGSSCGGGGCGGGCGGCGS
jgi:uncharacterized protein (TIGR04222 family)